MQCCKSREDRSVNEECGKSIRVGNHVQGKALDLLLESLFPGFL